MQSAVLALPYGAWELKRAYQLNFAIATIIAVLIAVMPVISFNVYQSFRTLEAIEEPPVVIRSIVDFAPPSIVHTKPMPSVAVQDMAPPAIGIPAPVPDEQIVEEVRFATRDELAQLTNPVGPEGIGDGDANVVVEIPDNEEYFPKPDEFVAVEEMPILIHEEKPVYPEMAALTGKSGIVYIEALVDRQGKVREARIVKSSGSSVGFDESALAASYKCLYRPAIQNGQPVAIRITYPVKFILNK